MDEYSIENTHEALKQRLIDYVETAYFENCVERNWKHKV